MNQLNFKFATFAYTLATGYFTIADQFRILCLVFYFVHFRAREVRDTAAAGSLLSLFMKYFQLDILQFQLNISSGNSVCHSNVLFYYFAFLGKLLNLVPLKTVV